MLEALALSSALLLGVLPTPTPLPLDDETVFEDVELGFRWPLPAGWVWERSPGRSGTEVRFTSPDVRGVASLKLLIYKGGLVADAEQMRQSSIDYADADPSRYSEPRLFEAEIDGLTVPALEIEQVVEPRTWVRQLYVIRGDAAVMLQTAIHPDRVDEVRPGLEELWSRLELTEPAGEDDPGGLLALAQRCKSDLDWAASWEEAKSRAERERRPILVYVRMYAGFNTRDNTFAGFFMEPEIRELVDRRYVPFELERSHLSGDDAVPFAARDVYGLSPTTFGTSVMVVRPSGEVVLESGTRFARVLYDALALVPDLPGDDEVEPDWSDLERARNCFGRGEVELAAERLGEARSAAEHLLAARIARHREDGEAALGHLDRAEESVVADAALSGEIAWLRARTLANLRRDREALAILAAFPYAHPDHERGPDAAYLLGALQALTESEAAADATWTRLAKESPEEPAAWRAAGALTGTAYVYSRWVDQAWSSHAQAEASRPRDPEVLPRSKESRASEEAVRYLVETQDDDGSWVHGLEHGRSSTRLPDEIKFAATALCAQALLPHRGDEHVARAIDRAFTWLELEHARIRRLGLSAPYMDYTTWGRAYGLAFVADSLESGAGDRERLLELGRRMAVDLQRIQRDNGGWSYHVSGDPGSGASPDHSISFVTAAAVLGLVEARSAGVVLPDGLLERALDCLEESRRDDGVFVYMLWSEDRFNTARDSIASAAGRGPACELALLRGGRGSLDALTGALDAFREHDQLFAAEVGKSLMHAGPDGQGSHYPLFDWATSAMAAAELGRRERRPYTAFVYEELMQARSVDGAFCDNPIMGWAPGTGLALQALNALDVAGR